MMFVWSPSRIILAMAVGVIAAGGVRLLVEHDARLRAEGRARELAAVDSLKTGQWLSRVAEEGRRVDTLIIATRATIEPTREVIREAERRITDTLFVRTALDSAARAVDRCEETMTSCAVFRETATAALDSMSRLLRERDRDRLNLTRPAPAPRISRGLSLGLGYCLDITGRRAPCVSLSYALHLRLF